MDALAGFLDGPRARGAFLLRAVLDPPWALRVQDEASLTVLVILTGSAWFIGDDGAVPLRAGDVAIIRGPSPYTVADHPETTPDIVIHPGGQCATPEGDSLSQAMDLGVRTWGNCAAGAMTMLVGTYQTDGEVSRLLLDALPRFVALRAGTWDNPIGNLLAEEIAKEDLAQQVVLDRLLDLLLVTALRRAFASGEIAAPTWFSANADPIVGRVIRMMQNDPGRQWTVAGLASAVSVSRALLARRFQDVVGEPPIAFLTTLRMDLAADLMLEPDATVTAVARAVGYGSPFTFSTAFKRTHGVSPRAHRDRKTTSAIRTGEATLSS